MRIQNRRSAMGSMAALCLTACGGGERDAQAEGSGSATAAPPTGTPLSTGAAGTTPSVASLADRLAAQPATTASADVRQFLIWDAGDGPSREMWSQHLLIRWKNPNVGDWIDADGEPQGATAFAAQRVTMASAWIELDVSALVDKAVRTRQNKGFTLRSDDVAGAKFAGRLSTNAPQLLVDGQMMPLLAFAAYSTTSAAGLDTRQVTSVSRATTGVVQFELSGLGAVNHAALRLYVLAKSQPNPLIQAFECDAPPIVVGAASVPRTGLAAEAGSEAALKSHPDVLRAGDFSNLERGVVFDGVSFADGCKHEQLPDLDAPGSVMYRGEFRAGSPTEGLLRGSASFKTEHMRADLSDPLRPPAVIEEEMFCRVYFFLEDDWNSARDGNKMAIGWDLRMGWWNDAHPGYWQSTTGNGGARGTGLKLLSAARKNGASQSYDCWEYQGHSIRMEAGRASVTGNPYADLRPVQSYVYNLDQATEYGDMFRLGSVCIRKGRWFCVEQQVRMNGLSGLPDALGNRDAVPDGILRTWVDGVLASEITNLRWRRHPQMGIQGPWINWFYGGKQPSEMNMHYRMNHFAVARRYIGPRAG
jgi:hypothetical protein